MIFSNLKEVIFRTRFLESFLQWLHVSTGHRWCWKNYNNSSPSYRFIKMGMFLIFSTHWVAWYFRATYTRLSVMAITRFVYAESHQGFKWKMWSTWRQYSSAYIKYFYGICVEAYLNLFHCDRRVQFYDILNQVYTCSVYTIHKSLIKKSWKMDQSCTIYNVKFCFI